MKFAENLMELRRQRGWSQEELGNQVGVSRQTVSKWELGQTTPELEKLVELAKLLGMSLDELVGQDMSGKEFQVSAVSQASSPVRLGNIIVEYISPVKVFGLPLIHIRHGYPIPRLAKGIIAIGDCAVGVVAFGGVSLGVISLGGLSAGLLLSLGGASLGLLSMGGLAIGGFAIGGMAVGQWLAIGGGAASNYLAIGGGTVSNGLAVGDIASGYMAIGETVSGKIPININSITSIDDVWASVKAQFPQMWSWVRGVIERMLP